MKVIEENHFDQELGAGYVFTCPRCGSKIEIHERELTKYEGSLDRFLCPVCKNRYETWWLDKFVGSIRYALYKKKKQSGT